MSVIKAKTLNKKNKKTLVLFLLLCQLHLLHAREITPTQVKPDSGSSPTLTFLYRIIWPESKSSSSPCGREAERYRTTGSGWKSEEEEETQDTTKKTLTSYGGTQDATLTLIHIPMGNPSPSHTPDRDLLFTETAGGSYEIMCVSVCVLIKHSSMILFQQLPVSGYLSSSPPSLFLSSCETKYLIHSFLIVSLPAIHKRDQAILQFREGKRGKTSPGICCDFWTVTEACKHKISNNS